MDIGIRAPRPVHRPPPLIWVGSSSGAATGRPARQKGGGAKSVEFVVRHEGVRYIVEGGDTRVVERRQHSGQLPVPLVVVDTRKQRVHHLVRGVAHCLAEAALGRHIGEGVHLAAAAGRKELSHRPGHHRAAPHGAAGVGGISARAPPAPWAPRLGGGRRCPRRAPAQHLGAVRRAQQQRVAGKAREYRGSYPLSLPPLVVRLAFEELAHQGRRGAQHLLQFARRLEAPRRRSALTTNDVILAAKIDCFVVEKRAPRQKMEEKQE